MPEEEEKIKLDQLTEKSLDSDVYANSENSDEESPKPQNPQ